MKILLKALKAVAEETRLRILASLVSHELTVTELVALLGQSQPRVSRHLKLMVDAGLLIRYQEGSWVFHRLADQGEAAKVATAVQQLIDWSSPTFARDRTRLNTIKQQNAERAAAYFSQNAAEWDELRQLVGSDDAIESALLTAVTGQEINTLIDLGTGTGRILQIFAPTITKGIGYDNSHEMLNVARANLEQDHITHCLVRQADIRDIPQDDASADLITIHQVLHYLDDPHAVVQEAERVLRPGGKILIVDFAQHHHEFLRSDHAHRRLGFSDDEIKAWCEQNALILQHSHTVSHGGNVAQLNAMLWEIYKPNNNQT